jgi:hypothetical protein
MYRSSRSCTIRRRRKRICCPITIPTHFRDCDTTTIIHNTIHQYNSINNYIRTVKVPISYLQQLPQRYSSINSTRFLNSRSNIVYSHTNRNNYYYKSRVHTEIFSFRHLHSQRRILSDTTKASTIATTKHKMNPQESIMGTTPSTPTISSPTTTGNHSIAKIDTATDPTKEDETEVRYFLSFSNRFLPMYSNLLTLLTNLRLLIRYLISYSPFLTNNRVLPYLNHYLVHVNQKMDGLG